MTINTQKLRAFRQSLQRCASNTGHGHVYMRPDGFLAKCGGPGICTECAKDLALLMAHDGYEPPTTDDLVDTIDAQAAEIAEAKGQIEHLDRRNNALRQSLGSMIHAYVRLLECGRDRILDLGGQCDPLDVLEANDPWLRDARATLQEKSNVPTV